MLNTILLTLMDDRVKIFIVGEEELFAVPDISTVAIGMKPSPLSVLDLGIPSITSMMAKKKGNATSLFALPTTCI